LDFDKTNFSAVKLVNSENKQCKKIDLDEPMTIICGESGVGKSSLLSLQARNFNAGKKSIFETEKSNAKIFFTSQQLDLSFFTWREFLFDADISVIRKLLEEFELQGLNDIATIEVDNKINFNSYNLSGGQMQRLFLIRALLSGADVLILDETLSGIPKRLCHKIVNNIIFQEKRHIIYVGHNFQVNLPFTAKMYTVLDNH
jgi:ABC-type bacteriocin/lantibiotic exporter with double-glycine peptidase domain